MEAIHIKIDFEEAISAKKTLLSSELSLLDMSRKMHAYQNLRKDELVLRERLRVLLSSIAGKLGSLKKKLPKSNVPVKERIKETIKEKEAEMDIEEELQEIKAKLNRLNY